LALLFRRSGLRVDDSQQRFTRTLRPEKASGFFVL